MKTSRQVTIEDAAQYAGLDAAAVLALAGDRGYLSGDRLKLEVRAANGQWLRVRSGDWVVKFGEGDLGVMSAGEWDRWFGR